MNRTIWYICISALALSPVYRCIFTISIYAVLLFLGNDLLFISLLICFSYFSGSASSPEERMQIRDQEIEILRMIDKKDSEIRNAEMEAVKIVDEKDSEKRAFNWKAIAAVSTVLVTIIGIGGAMLGGNFNLKLPKK